MAVKTTNFTKEQVLMREILKQCPNLRRATIFLLQKAHTISYNRANRLMQGMKLTLEPRDFWVLLMADCDLFSQQTIADSLGINRNSMVILCDRLEALKLIERQRNPKNRREYILRCTRAGGLLVGRWLKALDEEFKEVMIPLSEKDSSVLNNLLLRVIESETPATDTQTS